MTRRRHQVLIAVAVLAVFIGGLWWVSRPQVDPRFVGTWSILDTRDGESVVGEVRLNANGSGSVHLPRLAGRHFFTWIVERGEFGVIDQFSGPPMLLDRASSVIQIIRRPEADRFDERYGFSFDSSGALQLRHLSGGWNLPTDVYLLRRVLE